MEYEVIIGLEVHAQLSTKTKIFCGCSTQFGNPPNSQVCPVCLGMPGSLPVLNQKVVEYAIKMGLATNSKIAKKNVFARKNYFYPDLPKGYQISQFEEPICYDGFITINENSHSKKIGLTRIHMEEDAGKSVHDESYVKSDETFIDLNRCGTPLIEIVSEPDIRSAQEAAAYVSKLRQIVRYLGICDGNMEEGSLRCDANISLRPKGQKAFGTKTELKNMNSIRHVEKALEFEIKRQKKILEKGGTIIQETLLWDPNANEAITMRSKEESHDYRYFPDPDLVPVEISMDWLNNLKESLPELPDEKKSRFIKQYAIPEYDAEVLTSTAEIADYFEETCKNYQKSKVVSNWVMGEVLRIVKDQKLNFSELKITPGKLAQLLNSVEKKIISSSAAKAVFEEINTNGGDVKQVIEKLGLQQVSDESELENLVNTVISENPNEVQLYKNGKDKLFGFFVGQVMRLSKGKANPQKVNEILKNKLQ